MATNNKQQVNIGAWDAMMAKVAGMPEIEQLVAEVDRLRAEVDEGNAALHEQIQAWMSQKAEVDRLRAREQALQLQLDAMSSLLLDVQRDCVAARQEANAMRPIVEAVAIGSIIATGSANTRITGPVLFNTFADMSTLLEQARAFVAAHPATDTAGEAESEGE